MNSESLEEQKESTPKIDTNSLANVDSVDNKQSREQIAEIVEKSSDSSNFNVDLKSPDPKSGDKVEKETGSPLQMEAKDLNSHSQEKLRAPSPQMVEEHHDLNL